MGEETEIIKKQGWFKQLSSTGQLTRFIVYLSAAVPAIVFIVLALVAKAEIIEPITIGNGESNIIIGTWYDYIVFAVIG